MFAWGSGITDYSDILIANNNDSVFLLIPMDGKIILMALFCWVQAIIMQKYVLFNYSIDQLLDYSTKKPKYSIALNGGSPKLCFKTMQTSRLLPFVS